LLVVSASRLGLIQEEFEDTKGVISIRISKKNRQWPNEKVQKDNQRSQKLTHKPKNGGELRCSGRVSSPCSTSDTRRVNLVTHSVTFYSRRNCVDIHHIL
jgi:hypothetical protein